MLSKPVFSMSASGYCPKRQSARLLGTIEPSAPPKWLQSSAEEGNWHEARLKAELVDEGCQILDEQRELVLHYPRFDLVGHIDGRTKLTKKLVRDTYLKSTKFEMSYINTTYEEFMDIGVEGLHHLEVKTMSFLEFQRWLSEGFEGFPWYASQQTCYQTALNDNFTVYAIKDRSNGTRHIYLIKGTMDCMDRLVSNFNCIVDAAEKGEYAESEFDLGRLECRRCEFRTALCLPRVTNVDNAILLQAVRDRVVGLALEKEGKEKADKARDLILVYSEENKVDSWKIETFIVKVARFPRETVSIRALEAIMPREHFESAINVSKSERVTIVNTNKED